jgi:hypothetical protein
VGLQQLRAEERQKQLKRQSKAASWAEKSSFGIIERAKIVPRLCLENKPPREQEPEKNRAPTMSRKG